MSHSPPSTPPTKPPLTAAEDRFKAIKLPCECVEQYRPGGYHPVQLGDLFHDGQYEVIRKLGHGNYSTVWLAYDSKSNSYVALKIVIAEADSNSAQQEARVFKHIVQSAPDQADQYIVKIIEEFEHKGPNGVHRCLVFKPMGPDVNVMLEVLKIKHRRGKYLKPNEWMRRYPPRMVKSILKQSLQALKLLHDHGIVHGDFQPGNILFTVDHINSESRETLAQPEKGQLYHRPTCATVERKDGKEDRWAPKHLFMGESLASYTDHAQDFRIKLSDLGAAFFFDSPPEKYLVPIGLRTPELILTGKVGKSTDVDIWSWGCLLFELMTGCSLFSPAQFGFNESEQDDDQLLNLSIRLGPLPDDLYKLWDNSSLYFTPERVPYNFRLGGASGDKEPFMFETETLEEMFDKAKVDMSDEEAKMVKALLRRILQYDTAMRPSAGEILGDTWFTQS